MKNYMKKLVMLVLVVLGTSTLNSCKKYLERSPLADILETDPYKNFRNFQGFTEELYNCLPLLSTNQNHNSWNLGEEDFWTVGETRLMSYQVDQGNYPAWTSTFYNMFGANNNVNPASTNNVDKGFLWTLS